MSRMESLLIIAKDEQKAENQALLFCKEKRIETIDVTIFDNETIGIEQIRNLQKTLFLKPIRSKIKACIIKHAHNLTIEAQNALLKILEEPPQDTIIILTAQNHTVFLPTILSRCKLIKLDKPNSGTISQEEILEHKNILVYLQSASIGEKMKLAQDVSKNKDDVLPWLEKMILALRQKYINDPFHYSLFIIYYSLLQQAYITIKTTNANPRLTLENFLLNL